MSNQNLTAIIYIVIKWRGLEVGVGIANHMKLHSIIIERETKIMIHAVKTKEFKIINKKEKEN